MQIKNDIYESILSKQIYVRGKGSDVRLDLQLSLNTKKPNVSATITGVVVDLNNTPIQGAVVKLTDGNFKPLTNTTTDNSGNYSFNYIPYSNIYSLIAIASGKLLS